MPASARPPQRVLIGHLAFLSLLAFAAHFVWEMVQCPIFFVHGTYDATRKGMIVATLGDVGMTWTIYAIVALASGRWRWERHRWRATQWLTLTVASLAISTWVEWRGLHEGRWWYTDAMPTLPGLGVGLVPLVQMVMLTPALIAATARLLDRRRRPPAPP
jgi:hypothetical protein